MSPFEIASKMQHHVNELIRLSQNRPMKFDLVIKREEYPYGLSAAVREDAMALQRVHLSKFRVGTGCDNIEIAVGGFINTNGGLI